MSEGFDDYQRRLFERHKNSLTSWLSTAGDVVMAGGFVAGIATRRARIGGLGLAFGFGIAAIAHLFQPGTLRDELVAVFRHPIWALRGEAQRITGGVA